MAASLDDWATILTADAGYGRQEVGCGELGKDATARQSPGAVEDDTATLVGGGS